jgi:hypothetical protein
MKKILFFLMTIFSAIEVNAQSEEAAKVVFENIGKAFREGDASQLAVNFSASFDIILPGNEETFNKQAEMILKDFFNKNKPKGFVINHQGTSNDGSRYAIGTYKAVAQNYRAYILLKSIGNKLLISQLQLEKD